MYKIVPAERQECSERMITKNRCKPSKSGLQRSFLAPPAGFEPVACRLGGDRSIQLSYGGVYRKYSILQGSRIRTIRFLGGVCYIRLTIGADAVAKGESRRFLCRLPILHHPRGDCQSIHEKMKKELAFFPFSWYHNLCVREGGVTYAEYQIC